MFIKLTNRNGDSALVNTDNVDCVAWSKGGAFISFSGDGSGAVSFVKETVEEVFSLINQAENNRG